MFCRRGRKREEMAFLVISIFAIHLQILILSVLKIVSLSAHWLQIKFSVSVFFYLFTFATNLWHWSFVRAGVTAVFVNNQHGIQRRGQDFDKVCIWRARQQIGWQPNFVRKTGQSVVLISCWKSCGTQTQLTGNSRPRSARTEVGLNVETVNDLVLSQQGKLHTHRTVREISQEMGIHQGTQNAICLHFLRICWISSENLNF